MDPEMPQATSVHDQAGNISPLRETPKRTSSACRSPLSCAGSPLLSCSASPRAQAPRLQVVLDIDHTLLHAAEAPAGSEAQPPEGVHSFMLAKPRNGGTARYHVRTRHGLHSFLRELQEFADVHIYTMAWRSYTREVLNSIDPDAKLVAGRVFCREDGQTDTFFKSLTHLQSDMAALASYVVVDDRDDVWDAVSRPFIMKVSPFKAFKLDGTIVAPPRNPHASVSETLLPDPTLMDVLRVLKRVHLEWVNGVSDSCAEALQGIRASVLEGVHAVFSGGLIKGPDSLNKGPEVDWWRMAEGCGARCHFGWHSDEPVTHVVSGNGSTNTVLKAVHMGIHAVNECWLKQSAARWRRQAEETYPIQPSAVQSLPERMPMLPAAPTLEQQMAAVRWASQELVPSSLDDNQRVSILLRFAMGAAKRPQLDFLLARFDEVEKAEDADAAEWGRVVGQLEDFVGVALLKAVGQAALT